MPVHDWNAVITVREGGFRDALTLLAALGAVARTPFYNVLVMRCDAPLELLPAVEAATLAVPALAAALARVVPVEHAFGFQSPASFEAQAREAAGAWLERLGNSRFHVRMHRRGFHGRLSSQAEERLLDHFLLGALEARGTPARIDFADPDAILAVETVGQRAGLSLWSREALARHPLLGLD